MIDHSDIVVKRVRIGFVEVNPLLDDGLIVPVQRETGAVVRTRAFEVASLDHQYVVTPVPVLIRPMADGIAGECRLDILADVSGPVASVGKDSTRVVDVLHQEMGGLRRDDAFHRLIHVHHPGHAGRKTSKRWVSALSAGSLILEVGLENGPILLGQRSLARARPAWSADPLPLAL